MHSTKISGLAVDTEYSFHLVLRTTAGTFASRQVAVRTHKMTDLSGITITTGIMPAGTREALSSAVERIGAKIVDSVRIDTTHFVTTEGRGVPWEKAVEMNIPVVRPEWVEACERNGRILGVTKFYLDALRPGPPSEEQTRTTATPPSGGGGSAGGGHGGGGSSGSAAPAQQKDLPDPPPAENGDASKEAGAKKEEGGAESSSEEDDDDETEHGGGENKTRATTDEQKVRLEDKEDQKVALRPGEPSTENVAAGEAEGDESGDDKTPTPSPGGDAASFQDVQL
ncbi:BRCT domain-containing protein [Biscogniauxia marginata]|nr:BRCT domain-containing protein [Biscogniauxia marginata]